MVNESKFLVLVVRRAGKRTDVEVAEGKDVGAAPLLDGLGHLVCPQQIGLVRGDRTSVRHRHVVVGTPDLVLRAVATGFQS